jgi:hypothetical protein
MFAPFSNGAKAMPHSMNKKDVLQFTTKTLQKWIQTDYKLTTKTL